MWLMPLVIAHFLEAFSNFVQEHGVKRVIEPFLFTRVSAYAGVLAILILLGTTLFIDVFVWDIPEKWFTWDIHNSSSLWYGATAGASIIISLLFRYIALEKSSITAVMPLLGVFVPFGTITLEQGWSAHGIGALQIIALACLLSGAILFGGNSILGVSLFLTLPSALALAAFLVTLKRVFSQEPILNAIMLLGLGYAGIYLFLLILRRIISQDTHEPQRLLKDPSLHIMTEKGEQRRVFWSEKLSGVGSSIFLKIALYLAPSATTVSAFQGIHSFFIVLFLMRDRLRQRAWKKAIKENWKFGIAAILFVIGSLLFFYGGN